MPVREQLPLTLPPQAAAQLARQQEAGGTAGTGHAGSLDPVPQSPATPPRAPAAETGLLGP